MSIAILTINNRDELKEKNCLEINNIYTQYKESQRAQSTRDNVGDDERAIEATTQTLQYFHRKLKTQNQLVVTSLNTIDMCSHTQTLDEMMMRRRRTESCNEDY